MLESMDTTIKLYESDQYLKECEARIISGRQRKDGLYEYVLDKTIFYPTGGGQPHDYGLIETSSIIDVYKDNEFIYHVLESSLEDKTIVRCVLNWEKRFDHMQQHTGQHILSRAFELLYGADTVGFSLGTDTVTIDVKITEINQDIIDNVEEQANKIISENKDIYTNILERKGLSKDLIHKIPNPEDYIRLVIIDGFDKNACAGTHLKNTLEVGLIKIITSEKIRDTIRIYFVCGKRAINYFSNFQKELMNTAGKLKTNWRDVCTKTQFILEENYLLEKGNKELKQKLLKYEIEELKSSAEIKCNYYLLTKTFKDRDIKELKQLASNIIESSQYIVFFTNLVENKVQFLLNKSNDLPIDMDKCLKVGLDLVNGKGGGNSIAAQGGGENNGNLNEAIDKIKIYISNNL